MTLPLIIAPNDPGHIDDHQEIHTLLSRLDGQSTFLAAGSATGALGSRPAASASNLGDFYFAASVPALAFSDGALWRDLVVASAANTFSSINNFTGDVFFGSGMPWFDVQSATYGATGDGVTDDSPAIRAATAAAIGAGGGIVWFPGNGTIYMLASSITVGVADVSPSVVFQGPGVAHGARLRPIAGWSAGTAMIDVGDAATLVERWAVRGLHFQGRDSAGNLINVLGIRGRRTAQFEITDCYFETCQTGIDINSVSSVFTISRCVVGSNNVVGMRLDLANDFRVIGNDLQEGRVGGGSSSHAINAARIGANCVIAGNKINNWEGYGIIVSAFAGDNRPGVINGNVVRDTGNGIGVDEGQMAVTGNAVYDIRAGGNGIEVSGANTLINGNVILTASGTTGINISANSCVVVGNIIDGTLTNGVRVASSLVLVDCNLIAGTISFGINEVASADNNKFGDSNVFNIGAGVPIQFVGASTNRPVVTSAGSITLPFGYKAYSITGTTDIATITAAGYKGQVVTLTFAGVLTVNETGNLRLTGNFTTSANDTLTLECDGSGWNEIARAAN